MRKNNLKKENRFEIDFFEFAFLVEACIPPRPIARAMFWEKVIEKHYHDLTISERERLLEWTKRNPCFNMENEDCALFEARFNKENQYKITTLLNEKESALECFKWKDCYHTSKDTSVNEKYITKVEKI